MMNYRSFYLVMGIMILATAMRAQCPGTSPFWGLNCFLNSEFIGKFGEARNKAEQSVRDFKQLHRTEQFSQEEVERVMDAYNASANEFNNVLYKIKEDLLDKKKRKYVLRYPDDYALQIEAELNKARDYYSNTYQLAVTKVTNGRITGTPLLLLLPEIIKYGKLAFELYKKIKDEVKKYNNALFDQYLIEESRFHSWDEISIN
ncbi:MAG: hypothetical protein IPL65_11130 [Lewinellaceae bacterium]|nr:hypothetical protein [Lewinellaceae bacterium]